MTNKPLCVIVDDEEHGLAALREAIEEIDLLEIERAFIDPDRFLLHIDSLDSQIIFLDMEMPILGVDVARKLKGKLIVFVSGYTDKAYQTFEVNAVDFVPKPIMLNRLKTAIEKVIDQLKKNKLVVKTPTSKREEISPETISFICTNTDEKRDKEIYNGVENPVLAKNIKFTDLLIQLPNHFIQINPQYIVNTDKVTKLLNSDTVGIEYKGELKEFTIGEKSKEKFFKLKPQFR